MEMYRKWLLFIEVMVGSFGGEGIRCLWEEAFCTAFLTILKRQNVQEASKGFRGNEMWDANHS